MKQIGFKNFRRFIDFPNIDLGDITLMVGGNNSGKSTLVKAILLVIDYLKNQKGATFAFADASLDSANVVTFDRALCKLQDEPYMSFSFQFEQFDIQINLKGKEHAVNGDIIFVSIFDCNNNIDFLFNYSTQSVSISKINVKTKSSVEEITSYVTALDEELQKMQNELLLFPVGSKSFLEKTDQINALLKKRQEAADRAIADIQVINEPTNLFKLSYSIDLPKINRITNFLGNVQAFIDANEDEMRMLINKREKEEGLSEEENDHLEEVLNFRAYKSEIFDSIEFFLNIINSSYIYYWGAEPQKQSALFSIRDKKNALAQAIHEYYQLMLGESGGEEERKIRKWMIEFKIGTNFHISTPLAGEAYQCSIIDENGKSINLADKGMGSLQIMTLLFRLATIIKKHKGETIHVTLIIEEPELNLHPALQSKLAELFYEVNKKNKIKFIVETHSEYLIRRSQVIVANEEFVNQQDLEENNMFKVYYFPTDALPYSMNYRTDGKFSNEFGEGFYDVSSDLSFEIL